MTGAFHRPFFLKGPAGRLEATFWTTPVTNPCFVAVVCHPHPLYGGTMHNKVVYRTAQALHQCGAPVLRFNFRGAGLSEGTHDNGRGEEGDVRAALDYLEQEFPGRPILLAGFSFGSWVGLRVGCSDARVTKLIAQGLPVDSCDFSYLHNCAKPKLVIQGGNDQYGSRVNVEALFTTLREPKHIVIVEGADHFFTGRLPEVSAAITGWIESNE
jgi:alpha/beta superfamily hydrolase